MSSQKIRLGIAGLGIGSAVHIPAFSGIPGIEIIGVAGRRLGKAKAVAEKFDIPNACQSVDELFDLEIDAISLALPPSELAVNIEQALKRNIPVFCEKPMCNTHLEANRIIKMAQGTPNIVNFQFAELPAFKKLKEILDQETFGLTQSVEILWHTQSWAQKQKKWSWKTDQHLGGGALSLNGSHILYLSEWLFGKFKMVSAHLTSEATSQFAPSGKTPADDHVQFTLLNENKLSVSANISNAQSGNNIHRWTIKCQSADLILENKKNDYMSGFHLFAKTGTGFQDLILPLKASLEDGRIAPCRSLAQKFVDKIIKDDCGKPDFTSGLRVLELMDAIRRSKPTNKLIGV